MSGRPARRPRFWEAYISGTVSPIDKRSSLVGSPIPSAVHGTNAESCQCQLWHVARATWGDDTNVPPAVSVIGRLRWNLACTWGPISYSWCHSHGWGISARAHVQRYPHTALLYLGNGSADCVQIWYVGWGSLTKCLTQIIDGVHLHVRTCAPLFHKCSACCFSVTVGPIALKCGMHLGTH